MKLVGIKGRKDTEGQKRINPSKGHPATAVIKAVNQVLQVSQTEVISLETRSMEENAELAELLATFFCAKN